MNFAADYQEIGHSLLYFKKSKMVLPGEKAGKTSSKSVLTAPDRFRDKLEQE